jgi:hypothetical protein
MVSVTMLGYTEAEELVVVEAALKKTGKGMT